MKRIEYPMGTVSHATMRSEDLIPAFVGELQYRRSRRTLHKSHRAELRAIERRMKKDGYYSTEESDFDLEWLFDAMGEYAAPYFYFGSHPGDGSDYGYWLSEFWDENFDGLKVGGLDEVPADYRGEVMVINDHGNMSLYLRSARKFTEIWGIV